MPPQQQGPGYGLTHRSRRSQHPCLLKAEAPLRALSLLQASHSGLARTSLCEATVLYQASKASVSAELAVGKGREPSASLPLPRRHRKEPQPTPSPQVDNERRRQETQPAAAHTATTALPAASIATATIATCLPYATRRI